MYLIDTNVVSELFRPRPDPGVLDWYDRTPQREMYLSTITVAELYQGLALTPPGQRRDAIYGFILTLLDIDFRDRVLAFDLPAARVFGQFIGERVRQGLHVRENDALIAAIALARGMTVVTRNRKDFCGLTDLPLLNPFHA